MGGGLKCWEGDEKSEVLECACETDDVTAPCLGEQEMLLSVKAFMTSQHNVNGVLISVCMCILLKG